MSSRNERYVPAVKQKTRFNILSVMMKNESSGVESIKIVAKSVYTVLLLSAFKKDARKRGEKKLKSIFVKRISRSYDKKVRLGFNGLAAITIKFLRVFFFPNPLYIFYALDSIFNYGKFCWLRQKS